METERGLNRDSEEGGTRGSIAVAIYAAFPAVRAGLRALLEEYPGVEVVGDFSPERLEVGDWPPATEVALVNLQGESVNVWPPDLAARLPFPVVAIVDDPDAALTLLGSFDPPQGILLNDADGDQLASAITSAACGVVALAPQIVHALITRGNLSVHPVDSELLSAREHEVLRLMALGIPNKAIGLRLGISENTAKFHVGTILSKLGAASRTEAVMTAARMGWLPI